MSLTPQRVPVQPAAQRAPTAAPKPASAVAKPVTPTVVKPPVQPAKPTTAQPTKPAGAAQPPKVTAQPTKPAPAPVVANKPTTAPKAVPATAAVKPVAVSAKPAAVVPQASKAAAPITHPPKPTAVPHQQAKPTAVPHQQAKPTAVPHQQAKPTAVPHQQAKSPAPANPQAVKPRPTTANPQAAPPQQTQPARPQPQPSQVRPAVANGQTPPKRVRSARPTSAPVVQAHAPARVQAATVAQSSVQPGAGVVAAVDQVANKTCAGCGARKQALLAQQAQQQNRPNRVASPTQGKAAAPITSHGPVQSVQVPTQRGQATARPASASAAVVRAHPHPQGRPSRRQQSLAAASKQAVAPVANATESKEDAPVANATESKDAPSPSKPGLFDRFTSAVSSLTRKSKPKAATDPAAAASPTTGQTAQTTQTGTGPAAVPPAVPPAAAGSAPLAATQPTAGVAATPAIVHPAPAVRIEDILLQAENVGTITSDQAFQDAVWSEAFKSFANEKNVTQAQFMQIVGQVVLKVDSVSAYNYETLYQALVTETHAAASSNQWVPMTVKVVVLSLFKAFLNQAFKGHVPVALEVFRRIFFIDILHLTVKEDGSPIKADKWTYWQTQQQLRIAGRQQAKLVGKTKTKSAKHKTESRGKSKPGQKPRPARVPVNTVVVTK